MDALDKTARYEAAILNACYMLRHYSRGARSSIQQSHRTAAIQHLGAVLREALIELTDHERPLIALARGICKEDTPF